ncbi:MAG: nucleoside hydrolase [Actinobacteria bacterium]|nr:nucleoside hydrolase [Actinomycetota bacterium]
MKKIILDCDPGHDDMVAIILACSSDEIDLMGITTVAGNQTGDKTFINTLKVLTLINRIDIPVARGFDKPIFRKLTVAPRIHGVSGLDGAYLPEPDIKLLERVKTLDIHAVDFIIKSVKESDEKVTIVPTGPLTNIAIALLKEPLIKDNIDRIILMGGAVYDSNITPASEFNIYVDPEAAKIVFESGIPITMVGLDVTNKAILTFKDIEELNNLQGRVSRVIAPLLKFFAQANKDFFGIGGAPLHDALAVSYIIMPDTIKTKYLNVTIETEGKYTRGRTVVDVYNITGKEPNVDVAFEVNSLAFKKLIMNTIKKLDQR